MNTKLKCKSIVAALSMLLLLLFGTNCSDDNTVEPDVEPPVEDAQIAMVNITEDTDNADVLLLCTDGSYVMTCMNNGNGYGLLHCGFNVGGDETIEYTVMVDQDGLPVAIGNDEVTIQVANLTDTDFDCAVIYRGSDEIHYYWDIPYTFEGTDDVRSGGDTWSFTDPFKKWYRAVSGGVRNFTWDEHSKKMILPYIIKVTGFTVKALAAVHCPIASAPSMLLTFIDEGYKSGLWDVKAPLWLNAALYLKDYFPSDGKWTLKFFIDTLKLQSLDIFSDLMVAWGDSMYEDLVRCEPATSATFTNEEWQIKLSPTTIEAGPEAATYTVTVNTEANWTVEGGDYWCRAYRNGSNVVVNVDAYSELETRSCTLLVRTTTYTADIPSALLYVVQQGVLFELSQTSFSFDAEGGNSGVYVYTNDNIASWDVSVPSWVRIEGKADNSFLFSVAKNETGFDRTGTIIVTAITRGGNILTRTALITQSMEIPIEWDGTSWTFEGVLTANVDGETFTEDVSFDLDIVNVEEQQYELSIDLGSKTNLSLLSDGRLLLSANYSVSSDGENISVESELIFERTGASSAQCEWTSNIVASDWEVWLNETMTGHFNGTLKNYGNPETTVHSKSLPILLKQLSRKK